MADGDENRRRTGPAQTVREIAARAAARLAERRAAGGGLALFEDRLRRASATHKPDAARDPLPPPITRH